MSSVAPTPVPSLVEHLKEEYVTQVEDVASHLRAIADRLERGLEVEPGPVREGGCGPYTTAVQAVVNTVMWGMANANLDSLIRAAGNVDAALANERARVTVAPDATSDADSMLSATPSSTATGRREWGIRWPREEVVVMTAEAADLVGLSTRDLAVSIIRDWSGVTTGDLMFRNVEGDTVGPWTIVAL